MTARAGDGSQTQLRLSRRDLAIISALLAIFGGGGGYASQLFVPRESRPATPPTTARDDHDVRIAKIESETAVLRAEVSARLDGVKDSLDRIEKRLNGRDH